MKTNPTIFVADDDEEDIGLLRDCITERNTMASCTTFHNGLVLLNYLKNNEVTPDLIVLDINMPVKNGFLTLHELKQDASLSAIPVIMLTSSARKEDETRCYQMGCKGFFRKPDSLQDYISLAERLLLLA
ncbi:MAG: response regulator [Bacteroidota bacterium]